MTAITPEEAKVLMERVKGYMIALSEVTTGPDSGQLAEDITTLTSIMNSERVTSIHPIDGDAFGLFCKNTALDLLEQEVAELDNIIFLLEMARAIDDGVDQIVLSVED